MDSGKKHISFLIVAIAFALSGVASNTQATEALRDDRTPAVSAPNPAQNELAARTRSLLIDKLTQVYLNLAPADPSRAAITLRLADLHSERARMEAMKELSEGCTSCSAGMSDRVKALAYYHEILPKLKENEIGKVLAQVGHLYEMNGREQDAIETYNKIIQSNKSLAALAEAHLSLAEVFFKRRNYSQARLHFEAVLQNSESASKGLAAYRLAWCDFNEGRLEPAISGLERVLKNPALLTRNGSAGVVDVDRSFQEEVSRDLATFLARRPVQMADMQMVYDLSPESAKLNNAMFLAGETERLGQTAAAIQLWRFCQEKQTRPQLRLEGAIHLAQLEMESRNQKAAIQDFDSALALWRTMGNCETDNCHEMKSRLRKFVLDWNRVEKKLPSAELLAAYREYLKVFPKEADMTIWAAQVAKDQKDFSAAIELFGEGAQLAQASGKTADSETALLGAIEAAELSADLKLQLPAYDLYLAESKDQKHTLEVRYQKAHLLYEKADYSPAVTALRDVATATGSIAEGAVKLRKQAADLSLDGLVLLKDDARLEAWSKDYAKLFPQSASEFTAITRKSILNQAVAAARAGSGEASVATNVIVNEPASGSTNKATIEATTEATRGAESAWTTLMRFDLTGASDEEKANFYKNKLVLAGKLNKFSEARDATEQMLRLPNIDVKDRQFALSRKAWLSEMVLDFDSALKATEKLSDSEITAGQKYLRLAMYADLASQDSRPYLSQYLSLKQAPGQAEDTAKKVAVSAQLVRESKEPLKEWDRQKAIFSKNPKIVADLGLELFARSKNLEFIKKSLSTPGVTKTPAGETMIRVSFMNEYDALEAKIESNQLDSATQKKLTTTLKSRMALIEQSEKLATRAVESADWTSQLLALDLLAKQSARFYQEILALPVPKGLAGEDEQQYLMLLSQRAAPHQTRAKDVQAKVDEFWKNDLALKQMEDAMATSHGANRVILTREIQELSQIAPADRKAKMDTIAANKVSAPVVPSIQELEGARQAVRENPMSREKLEALLGVEKQMTTLSLNHAAMVSYLEGRLQTLPAKGNRVPSGSPADSSLGEPSSSLIEKN